MSFHLPHSSSQPYGQEPVPVVLDAYGRQVYPVPVPPPAVGHHCAVCQCDRSAAPASRGAVRWSPTTAVAAGAAGALVVGVVLVALLLSVAVVAASVATAALALTVAAVVLRSLLRDQAQPQRLTRRR
ncbi:hypothetical protein ACWD4B_27350 [Streptomyces sp. NPDC002536]